MTGQKVITDLFGNSDSEANLESAIEHIAVAQRTDLLLVVPATADAIAKFARGLADDFLSTLYLATIAPVIVAPAMNVNMWNHPATQENIATLRERGVNVVQPDEGYLACGMVGAGRLAAHEEILAAVKNDFASQARLSRRECAGDRGAYLRRPRSGALSHESLVREKWDMRSPTLRPAVAPM